MCAGVFQSETSERVARSRPDVHTRCTYALEPAPLSFPPPVSLLLALSPSPPSLLKTHQDACSEFTCAGRTALHSRALRCPSLRALSHRSSAPSRRPLLLASGCPSPLPPPPSLCFATQPPLQLVRSPVTDLEPRLQQRAPKQQLSLSNDHYHSLVSKPQPSLLTLRHTLPPPPMSSRFSSSRRSSVMDRMRNLSVVEEEAPVNEFGQISQSSVCASHTSDLLSLASSTQLTRPASPPPPFIQPSTFSDSFFLLEQL